MSTAEDAQRYVVVLPRVVSMAQTVKLPGMNFATSPDTAEFCCICLKLYTVECIISHPYLVNGYINAAGDYVSNLVPSFACTTRYSHLITSKKIMHAIF